MLDDAESVAVPEKLGVAVLVRVLVAVEAALRERDEVADLVAEVVAVLEMLGE